MLDLHASSLPLRSHAPRQQAVGLVAPPATGPLNLTVWRRVLPPRAARALARFVETADFEVDHILPARALDAASLVADVASPPVRAFLRDDLAALLAAFVRVSGATRVRVALGVKRTDACRKFHTDNVRLRLLTTYAGPGTEWLPDHAVRREALGHPTDCPCDANLDIVRDPSAVRRSRAGDVLLMRGDRAREGLGAVHRSPPIEARGLSRLVLAVTTVDDV